MRKLTLTDKCGDTLEVVQAGINVNVILTSTDHETGAEVEIVLTPRMVRQLNEFATARPETLVQLDEVAARFAAIGRTGSAPLASVGAHA